MSILRWPRRWHSRLSHFTCSGPRHCPKSRLHLRGRTAGAGDLVLGKLALGGGEGGGGGGVGGGVGLRHVLVGGDGRAEDDDAAAVEGVALEGPDQPLPLRLVHRPHGPRKHLPWALPARDSLPVAAPARPRSAPARQGRGGGRGGLEAAGSLALGAAGAEVVEVGEAGGGGGEALEE
eukprot:1598589-Rhodomonas_salina.1